MKIEPAREKPVDAGLVSMAGVPLTRIAEPGITEVDGDTLARIRKVRSDGKGAEIFDQMIKAGAFVVRGEKS